MADYNEALFLGFLKEYDRIKQKGDYHTVVKDCTHLIYEMENAKMNEDLRFREANEVEHFKREIVRYRFLKNNNQKSDFYDDKYSNNA